MIFSRFFYDILKDLVVILLHLRFYDIFRYFIPVFFVILFRYFS